MIIYNVTIKIDRAIEKEWLNWMLEHHIPDVMNTGMFVSSKVFKVLYQPEDGGTNYAIQYECENETKLDEYQQKYATRLQAEHTEKFKDRFVAFRTIMEVIR